MNRWTACFPNGHGNRYPTQLNHLTVPTPHEKECSMKFSNHLVQTTVNSPLGPLLLAASETHLAGLWFAQQRHLPDSTHWQQAPTHPLLKEAGAQLDAYWQGQRRPFDLPLDLSVGTAFQQAVWRALLAIPFGGTTSYGALSAVLGKPAAVRAVGGAVGRNPLGIIVPCHRVIGASGSLTGYAGGLDRKIALLQLEGVAF